jgi:hypothetical protein
MTAVSPSSSIGTARLERRVSSAPRSMRERSSRWMVVRCRNVSLSVCVLARIISERSLRSRAWTIRACMAPKPSSAAALAWNARASSPEPPPSRGRSAPPP